MIEKTSPRKKRLLYQSDFPLAKTGFGRNSKAILSYLWKTGKYEIHQICCGIQEGAIDLKRIPWKCYGAYPNDPVEMQKIIQDPNLQKIASYGATRLDEIVSQVKPDVYIAVQDHWGVDFSINKKWFNKISSYLWVTLDSLPLLKQAVASFPKVINYFVWSNFAQKEAARLGYQNVKTLHGAIETENFYPLSLEEKQKLRKENKISLDSFIIGFVFRNQLRKSVPNLIEGYKMFKLENPHIKNTKLLLHTNFAEGWNIESQCEIHGVDKSEVLTTYVCKNCGKYEVKPYTGQNLDCDSCKAKKSQSTSSVSCGVTEKQLNEIYNLMDVYVHPFTSGGQEIPIQEAKLAGLVTLVTNYSCGEEMCEPEAYSLPLDWAKYHEHGSEFIKASTLPSSIAKQLKKFYYLDSKKKKEWGNNARKWVLNNFSVEVIGKQIEKWLDDAPFIENDRIFQNVEMKDPTAQVPNIENNEEWIKALYKNILDMDVDKTYDGFQNWITQLENGISRDQVESYFRKVALDHTLKEKNKNENTLESLLAQTGKKRVLYIMPESIGDLILSASLFESIRNRYPKDFWDFYISTKPQYKEVLEGNSYFDYWIPYHNSFDNALWLEGKEEHKGYFDVVYHPYFSTQRTLDYLHNGIDVIDLEMMK